MRNRLQPGEPVTDPIRLAGLSREELLAIREHFPHLDSRNHPKAMGELEVRLAVPRAFLPCERCDRPLLNGPTDTMLCDECCEADR